jgi:hypothetical protein
VNAGGTPLGIARGGLEAFFERLPGRGITYTTYTNKSEAPITHLQAGEASLKIDSAAAHVARATALLDEPRSGPMTVHDRVEARARIGYATGLAREAVDLLFYASGASSIQASQPIQQFQRDSNFSATCRRSRTMRSCMRRQPSSYTVACSAGCRRTRFFTEQ